jgi:hypothetical protein
MRYSKAELSNGPALSTAQCQYLVRIQSGKYFHLHRLSKAVVHQETTTETIIGIDAIKGFTSMTAINILDLIKVFSIETGSLDVK